MHCFSSLDRPLFQAFINERNLDTSTFDSVIAWDQNYSYAIEAQAVFMVFNRLGSGWKILNFFVFTNRFDQFRLPYSRQKSLQVVW